MTCVAEKMWWRLSLLFLALLCCLASPQVGFASTNSGSAILRSVLYGGNLSDPQSANKTDQKLWLQLEGRAAKAVFNQLKENDREVIDLNGFSAIQKNRKGLTCRSAAKTSDYRCAMQIDLLTGAVLTGPMVDLSAPEPWYRWMKKDTVSYHLFTFSIGDPQPPKYGASILGIAVNGATAQLLFHAIGPDIKETCSTDDNPYRQRIRADYGVQCFYETNSKKYWCTIGLDLKNIKPVAATVC